MDNAVPQQTFGQQTLPPIRLTDEQENLCKRLDEWHSLCGLDVKPSDMLRGAVFAIRVECNSNPDRIAQSANSLREILYPFQSPTVKKVPDKNKKEEAFKEFGSVVVDKNFHQTHLEPLWRQLNDIAHHGVNPKFYKKLDYYTLSDSDFEKIILDFVRIMDKALTRQLDVHHQLDEILANAPQ